MLSQALACFYREGNGPNKNKNTNTQSIDYYVCKYIKLSFFSSYGYNEHN